MQAPFSAPAKLAGKQARRKPVISLTPLIDVVFILLVFFMLASSFMDWRSLSLDTSAAGEPAPAEQTPFVVQISKESLRLNGDAITLEALIDKARARQPADQPVHLQPSSDTRVQGMVSILDALSAAGVQPLKLVEDPGWRPAPAQGASGDSPQGSATGAEP
ncbi:ExbD/TolR family protein [Thiohalorhabdus sp.]|uniref:ExbD/TolR family protein n=1 Tax=Thiohalorhabdus sp. TaxID=3094134 RepID=UPI002FC35019